MPAGHLEIRLPEIFKAGMIGGPVFNTDIIEVESGYEFRNDPTDGVPRREYEIEYMKDINEVEQISKFFHVVHGRSYSFRFKDWLDFEVTTSEGLVGTGVGTGVTTYQLRKRYAFSGNSLDRDITKLVTGTYTIYKNATPVNLGPGAGNVQVNENTGIATFGTAPTGSDILSWSGEFDVPVRFTTDKFQCRLIVKDNVYEVVGLGLKEVLLT